MNIKKAILCLFFLFSVAVGSKESNTGALNSLDWQKVNLENFIRQKIEKTLSSIIKYSDYIVDVEIVTTPARKPKFTPSEDSSSTEAVKKERSGIDGVRINDVLPDQLPEDYVVFSKLGLEAPLIEDFNNFEKNEDGKGKDAKKGELPTFEQLWKFNKSLDVFNNLEKVRIQVKLSDQLQESTRQVISEVLNEINFNLNDIKPEIRVAYVDMTEKLNTQGVINQEIMELLHKFETIVAFLIGAIVIGLFAWVLFNKWAKLTEAKQESEMAAEMSGGGSTVQEQSEDGQSNMEMNGAPGEENLLVNGVERFETFLKNQKNEAILMIKKWINSKSDDEVIALRGIVQLLNNDDLIIIFNSLHQQERDSWKSILGESLTDSEIDTANKFIGAEIVKDILVPSEIDDVEAADLLLKMSPESAANFVKDDPSLGKIVLNSMSDGFVAKIFEHMTEDEIDVAVQSSVDYQKEEVADKMLDFKGKLAQYQESEQLLPFVTKLIGLIKVSKPSNENPLFKALASNVRDIKKISEVAVASFPAILIDRIPADILKNILTQYPMVKKVELVLSISQEKRQFYTDLFAPVGSKALDVLELEIEKARGDIQVMRKVSDNPDDAWNEFVLYARQFIKSDKNNQNIFENLVTSWAQGVIDGADPVAAANSASSEVTEIKSAA